MYVEEVFDYANETKYYKFTSAKGNFVSCHKNIKNEDIPITVDEYAKIKNKLDRDFIKFLIYNFLNSKNLILNITSESINILESKDDSPNIIVYYEFGNIIKKTINNYVFSEVENFVDYLYYNDTCIVEFEIRE